MPQRYYMLGDALGKAAGGSFNDAAFRKGEMDGANYLAHQAQAEKYAADARKTNAETEQLLQFQDPAKRSELVTGLLGLGKNEAGKLAAFEQDGNWGSGVFMRANPDLESLRGGLDFALKPPQLKAPHELITQSPDSTLAESFLKFSGQKDVVLPNATPEWADTAIRLNALVRGAGEKAMTPQTLPALQAQAAAARAIESGDMTALNVYNTLARAGATYTPYRSDAHGTTLNEGSGAVNVTDAPLHDSYIGKLLADAIQSKAAAANSTASTEKHRFDMANPKAEKYNVQLSEVFNALGDPVLTKDGKPEIDFNGRPIVGRNLGREKQFWEFMKKGGYRSTDEALVDFLNPVSKPTQGAAAVPNAAKVEATSTPESIKSAFKAGKLTREQAKAELLKLGFK